MVGKVVVAGRDKPIDWTQDVQSLTLKLSMPPEPVLPKPADFASEAEFTRGGPKNCGTDKPFWISDEGKALQGAQRTYVPLFNGDGSFRIEDVPPGTYTLRIALTEPSKTESAIRWVTLIGVLETEVTVPENADNTPLDLGTLSLLRPAPAPSRVPSGRVGTDMVMPGLAKLKDTDLKTDSIQEADDTELQEEFQALSVAKRIQIRIEEKGH